jgi:hypothetical protein
MLVKKSKEKLMFNMYANLIAGALLVIAGILLNVLNIPLIENKKAIIGLSLIPFGISFYSWLNLFLSNKYPKDMKPVIISENDERLIAIRNEADSITFQILQWALMLTFFGYTFIVPKDIFETLSWWIIFGFYLMSIMLQGIILSIYYRKNNKTDNDE